MPFSFPAALLDRLPVRAALTAAAAMAIACATPAYAADFAGGYPAAEPTDGVACSDGAPPWRTVWLGHYSGGRAFYDRQIGQVGLAWVDQKLCFPSRSSCNSWIHLLRRDFRKPEGYWTCLPLR